MWIVEGPNGAGKSTFTNQVLVNLGIDDLIKLNADEVTAAYRAIDAETPQNELNLRAAQAVDSDVAGCIKSRRDFLVETVLSSGKYRDDVEAAKATGFHFGLIYISLYPPELSPARVGERVHEGGHAVDYDTAIARDHRSHQELIWFASRADYLTIFDNSAADGLPKLIASQYGQEKYDKAGINPTVDAAMRQAFPDNR
jgi:predicted ABC-type ATPase